MQNDLIKVEDDFQDENEISIYDIINIHYIISLIL